MGADAGTFNYLQPTDGSGMTPCNSLSSWQVGASRAQRIRMGISKKKPKLSYEVCWISRNSLGPAPSQLLLFMHMLVDTCQEGEDWYAPPSEAEKLFAQV